MLHGRRFCGMMCDPYKKCFPQIEFAAEFATLPCANLCQLAGMTRKKGGMEEGLRKKNLYDQPLSRVQLKGYGCCFDWLCQ